MSENEEPSPPLVFGKGFPGDLTDEKIEETIEEARDVLGRTGKQRPESRISAYMGAMNALLIEKQNRLVNKSLKASSWFGRISLAIAFAAILISVILGTLSVRSSDQWQAEQIPLLQQITDSKAPATQAASLPAESREVTARTFKVKRVVDGDTFKIVYDGESTSVRLLSINAPERNTPEGPAATEALKELIDGKTVRLEFIGDRKRDNFGRLLCKVCVDEKDIGSEMIRRGHAKKYKVKRKQGSPSN